MERTLHFPFLHFSLFNNSDYAIRPSGGLQACEFRSNTSDQLPASTKCPNDSILNSPSNNKISLLTDYEKGPYEQFILFGDSITQMSCNQDLGFAWTPALQNGEPRSSSIAWAFALEYCIDQHLISNPLSVYKKSRCYQQRLQVNRKILVYESFHTLKDEVATIRPRH